MQRFKGDEQENKMVAVGEGIAAQVSGQRDDFFEGAYDAFPLGDLLWNENRSPLARAILQSIFRESFNEIFSAFIVAGSFESYLSVFRKIFGDDVDVTFTVPDPGKLNIDIVSAGFELSNFIARRVVDNAYVFDEVIDDEDDNIVFQMVKGFQSQYELEQMLYEMVPAGIYTEISLTVG